MRSGCGNPDGRRPVLRRIPGVRMIAGYQPRWLPKDLMAGLVLTAILVPQGMAYAELAGLPAITGLYTSILCLVGYAALGPSRILVLGPDSSLGPMIAATILPLAGANGSPARAVALASMLAILVGAMMILAGVAKLGFVADLLSKPTQIGYMTGLALTILVGQLPKLFGFSIHSDTLIGDITGFVDGVRSGETVTAAVLIGLFGLAVILVLQRWLPKVPGVLVAVVLSIGAAVVFDLARRGVSLVGTLPQGLPPFTIPSISASDLGLLVAGALGISLVALTDTISTASAFAARSGDEVQANQEMIGIGTSNVAAGLFQGFPVSTSGSRTAVADQSGAKTQITGLVGAAVIVLMLVVVPGLFRNLPQPTLAAVVMAAALSLADLAGMKRLWEVRRTEFALSIAAFFGVAVLGVLPGIAIAVGLSILNVFRRSWWPYSTCLGRVEGVPGYHDVRSYPDAETDRRPHRLPVRCPPVLCQRSGLPPAGSGAGCGPTAASLDRGGRRAHHRRRHNGSGHARGPRRVPQRARDLPGLRRDEGSGTGKDRTIRTDSDDRSDAFLPHHRVRPCRLCPIPAGRSRCATGRDEQEDGTPWLMSPWRGRRWRAAGRPVSLHPGLPTRGTRLHYVDQLEGWDEHRQRFRTTCRRAPGSPGASVGWRSVRSVAVCSSPWRSSSSLSAISGSSSLPLSASPRGWRASGGR